MKKAFVAGMPVEHSKSPALHGFWLAEYGIQGSYEAIAVQPNELKTLISTMSDRGFVGGNITIPHKESAFDMISASDDAAKAIGAVNTVWIEEGGVRASNTDAYGFSANLDSEALAWRDGQCALVLGAGGASRAVVYALLEAGFDNIRIANRTTERAKMLASHFGQKCSHHGLDELGSLCSNVDVFVNTTSLGMTGESSFELVVISKLPQSCIVTDIVYTPLRTPLLEAASAVGLKTVDGLGMLLHQAVPGFEKWFGVRPEVTPQLRQHILELL